MSITVEGIKLRYLPKLIGSTDNDATLTALKDDVIARAIEYLDSDVYADETDFDAVLESVIMKQSAYEFNRRRDLGLSSVSSPDGSTNRFENEGWLPDVKDTLDRRGEITIVGETE